MWLFKKTRPASTNLYSVAVLKSTNSNKKQCLVYQSKTWILLKIIFLGTYFTLTLFQLFTLKLKLISHSCIKQLTCVAHWKLKRTSTFKHPDYVIHLLTLRYVFMVGELGKAAWAPQTLPTFLWMANFSTSVILIELNLPCWNPQMPSLGDKEGEGGLDVLTSL